MALHPAYVCTCVNPRPKLIDKFGSEDSGLCDACNGVYDENLYQMRLQQHETVWNEVGADSLNDYLMKVDPRYKALIESTPR